MAGLQLSKALGAFHLAQEAEIDCGNFSVTIRQASPSNTVFRAEIAKRQRVSRRKIAPDSTTITGSLEEDVTLFCDMLLVDWTLKDDEDKPVPITKAGEVFLGSNEGRTLFFKLLQAALDDQVFQITEADQADPKN